MSMNVGGDGGGVKSDINVTPLVDVMLVLLIIMMIVAPLLQQGVPLTLPTAANTAEKPETQEQTVLAITADKRFYVNSQQVAKDRLVERVGQVLEDKAQKIVIIKADEDAEYGAVMEAMDSLRAAGIEDMGLITDPKRSLPAAGGGK
jgi:biopolymer transport protein TolR